MFNLIWTKRFPTRSGWYFWRNVKTGEETCVWVSQEESNGKTYISAVKYLRLREVWDADGILWAGPIQEPLMEGDPCLD